MCRAGGDKLKYMEVKMEEVVVSSVSSSGMARETAAFQPKRSVSTSADHWTYTQQQRADGSGGGKRRATWNLKTNSASA